MTLPVCLDDEEDNSFVFGFQKKKLIDVEDISH